RVGCFKYEDVDGAPANALPDQVPEEVKAERYARLMERQQAISAEVLAARVGKTIEVVVDEVDEEGAVARSHWDAPEIDGNVFIDDAQGLQPGDRLMATVTEASEYDLWASPARAAAGA
ncbi:MAG: 30S ribosomal protein S12 methylthiotransferase RimO, partial [Hyphomicrobiaceae bacterium]|nr:30S ribosomal protein S12 methylthiotransferase RimO [Hyphomicrobiaceae bacterium]